MTFIILLLIALIPYEVHGYALMCIGRKAGLKTDWMPYIPIARQIYQMHIANCPIWYIFLFGTTTVTVGCAVIVSVLLSVILRSLAALTFIVILIIIYAIAVIVFTFLYYRRFYPYFGFNPNTALLNIIPAFNAIALALDLVIGFSNLFHYGDYYVGAAQPEDYYIPSGAGTIIGVSGPYANSNFTIQEGAQLIFGRDPQQANIVFDESQSDVSRNHCTVFFDGADNLYVVTDHSTTGTYLDDGTRLQKEVPTQIYRGTTIYLGSSRKNGFLLS